MLFSRPGIWLIGVLAYSLLLLHWGDKFGPNSRDLAAIIAAQAERNGRLQEQAKAEAARRETEKAAASRREADYIDALERLQRCPMDQADVDAIIKRIGG